MYVGAGMGSRGQGEVIQGQQYRVGGVCVWGGLGGMTRHL